MTTQSPSIVRMTKVKEGEYYCMCDRCGYHWQQQFLLPRPVVFCPACEPPKARTA